MTVLQIIYYILWKCLHLIHSLFNLNGILFESRRQVLKVYSGKEKERLENALSQSGNMPKHLVLIMGNEDPSLENLANIIIWCLSYGIQFVSFYDHIGRLKQLEPKLFNRLLNKRNTSSGLVWKSMEKCGLSYKNGTTNRININVFSMADSADSLVTTVKQLCYHDAGNITIETVEKCLRATLNDIPDPELAICCGPVRCVYGFLPWQLRVTEVFRVDSHLELTSDRFLSILHSYSQIEQRFGK